MLLKDSKDLDAGMQPTKKNMIAAIRWLVKGAKLNDALFFHYSGHGGRTKDLSGNLHCSLKPCVLIKLCR